MRGESEQTQRVTRLLAEWGRGDLAALDELMPIVYAELRRIAGVFLRRERSGHTLQPTALINEAYLRLVEQDLPAWESRAHFFGVASRLMRQILVDHARSRIASKRGGGAERVALDDMQWPAGEADAAGVLGLDEALTRLAAFDERKCRVIEMRSFAGMTVEETAHALGVSVPTVKRETRLAQLWLKHELGMKS